jgi:hypothetical protein
LFDKQTRCSFFDLPGVHDKLPCRRCVNPRIGTRQNPDKDLWAKLTTPFADPLDVVGYNYLPNRYAADASRFPGWVIVGTETWPHQAYDFWQETERLPHVIGDFVWVAWDYLGEAGIGKVTPGERPSPGAYPYHLATCGDFDICERGSLSMPFSLLARMQENQPGRG